MIYALGDIIKTKKKHPCGGSEWEVVRTGSDYKLKCLKCGRVVMMTTDQLTHAVKGQPRGGRAFNEE